MSFSIEFQKKENYDSLENGITTSRDFALWKPRADLSGESGHRLGSLPFCQNFS